MGCLIQQFPITVTVKHNLVKWCLEHRNWTSSERWQDCDTSQACPIILVMRASYYSSVSLHSELISSAVITMELGSVLTCLSHGDNSAWAVFLIQSKWINEKTACLCPSSEFWLIWLIIVKDQCWRYKWSCTYRMLILTAACAALPYHLFPLT